MTVAIVRLTSLGDVIHTLPVAAVIRKQRPDARILWLVEEREQILLHDNPVVDEVVVVPLRRWRESLTTLGGWRQSLSELRALRRRLRASAIDVALDVQGWVHKTSPPVLATRAPIRIGFARSHSRDPWSPLFTNRHVTPPPEARHIVDQNLRLLGPLGLRIDEPPAFPLPAFRDGDAAAEAWRRSHGVDERHRLAVLLPSTRGAAKRWPVASFQEIGRRLLASSPDVHVLVLGGPGEEPILDAVRAGLPQNRAHVWAPGPIPDLVGIIRRAHLAVGNDTGPLHVAAASGVPAIGLFGPTRGARNGPYGAHCAYVQSPTGRMADIAVDEVWEVVTRTATW